MPTELEELVEFLHHGNTQIRQIACEHLVGYSSSNAAIFKKHQLAPITDLKLLVRDYPPIAKDALTILINLSSSQDEEVVRTLAEDDAFLTSLLKKVTSPKDPNAHLTSQLLANLSKSASLERLLKIELPVSASTWIAKSPIALNQLLDLFVSGGTPSTSTSTSSPSKGSDTDSDPDAHFDYLSYLLANLSAAHASIRTFLQTRQDYDGVVPLSKLVVFTTHPSLIRRRGVASTLKNVCFEAATHSQQNAAAQSTRTLLDLLLDESQVNILPYLLLPLAGNEEYSAEETEGMLVELQLLPADKQREADEGLVVTLVETLLLLTTTREGREVLRRSGVYPIIRLLHEKVQSEQVREVCERLVDMLMRDEADEAGEEAEKVKDREIEEVF
ncbi:hypothetical protein DV737_g2824, partial [Chaetothyriales sp. CBS 132003]